jgi:hypothetical protein
MVEDPEQKVQGIKDTVSFDRHATSQVITYTQGPRGRKERK